MLIGVAFVNHNNKWKVLKINKNKIKSLMDMEPGWLPSMGWQIVRHDWVTEHACKHELNLIQYFFFFFTLKHIYKTLSFFSGHVSSSNFIFLLSFDIVICHFNDFTTKLNAQTNCKLPSILRPSLILYFQ